MKRFLVPATVFLAGIFGVVEPFLAHYAPRHFEPERRLAAALEHAPERHAVVICGDSRTVAAIDRDILVKGLRRQGFDLPLANLALESTDVTWQCLALHRYLELRPDPALVVLGVNCDRLLYHPDAFEPSTWNGVNASNLIWAGPERVAAMYPRFPWAELDRGLRFRLAHATNLGVYAPLMRQKWQKFRDTLLRRRPRGPRNRFGLLEDMKELALNISREGASNLRSAKLGDGWRLNPLFVGLVDDLHQRGVPLVIVELPMAAHYREGVSDTPDGRALRAWLAKTLDARGARYVDEATLDWATDEFFPDGSHITPEGARRFSEELVEILADGPIAAGSTTVEREN